LDAERLCLIDPDQSPAFKRQLKRLAAKYRHAESDLADAYASIAERRKVAHHATAIPGFGGSVWKYRCPSSDQSRGQSGGFRI